METIRRYPLVWTAIGVALVLGVLFLILPQGGSPQDNPPASATPDVPDESPAGFTELVWRFEEAQYLTNPRDYAAALQPLATEHFLSSYTPIDDFHVKDVVVKVVRDENTSPVTWEESTDGRVRFVTAAVRLQTSRDGIVIYPTLPASPHSTTWIKTTAGWRVDRITEMR